jgi:hypothetical protein
MGQVEYLPPDRAYSSAHKGREDVVVTSIPNPFEPLVHRVTRAFAPGKTGRDYVMEFWPLLPPDREVMMIINGVSYHNSECYDIVMQPGDSLAFYLVPGKGGGGKQIITMVAMIALTIVTGGAGMGVLLSDMASEGLYSAATIVASTFGTSTAVVFGVGATIVGGAVMAAVGAMLPSGDSSSNQASQSLDASATYSWGLSNNPVVEGGPCPFLYGTVRITPPCIGRYVIDAASTDTDNKNQYLAMLFLVADHAVDSISDIWINGNPLSYYTDVTTETRLGTNDQTAISFYTDTISQKGSGAVLTATGWVSVRTDGNALQGLGLCLANDQGLFHGTGSTTESTSVTVQAQYRKVGSVTWLPFFDSGATDTKTISGNSTSPLFHYYRLDNLPDGPGQYEIQCRYLTAPSADIAYRNRTIISYIHEIIYDAFTYPGRSLLALKIKATDQLSGSAPSISCLVTRSTVSVSDGVTTYSKPANSPAWASLELLQSTIYGGQVSPSRCVWADFNNWATWCTSKGYTTNYYADTAQGLPKQLAAVGIQGRGTVVQFGSKFQCIVDRPVALPVQKFLFNVSNMRDFQESWAPMEGRANIIEITYFDSTADYSRQVVPVQAMDFDTTDIEVITQGVALPGCTDRAQALVYGQFLINCNRYLTNTITFTAAIDSLACTIGDVVDVQHAVPQWGFGGRVVSATATQVVLDQEMTMVAGTAYAIQIILGADDTRADVNVVCVPGSTNTLTIVGAWPGATPAADDRFAFGPVGYVSKSFRIVSMTRNGDFQRKLTALEYYEPVYEDAVSIPAMVNQSLLPSVYALIASELYDVVSGWPVPRVSLAWKGAALNWDVAYRVAGTTAWTSLGTVTYPSKEVPGTMLVPGTEYDFQVSSNGLSVISQVQYAGGPTPPDVVGLYSSLTGGALYLNWDPALCPYSVNYEVREGTMWATAQIIYYGPATSVPLSGPGSFLVSANSGMIYSATPAAITVTDTPLIQNVIATFDEFATGWTGTKTDDLAIVGAELWLVGGGDFYAAPDVYAISDVYTYGGIGPVGTYTIPTGHQVDIGTASPCNVVVRYSLRADGVYDDFYAVADVYAESDVYGGWGSFVLAQPQIRMYNGGAWGSWINYSPGTYTGQKFDMRIVLSTTSDTALAILTGLSFSVDVPDRVDWHKGVSVPITGLNFTHTPSFRAVPSTVVQILSATQGDDDVLTAETVAGGTLFIYNGGVAVARSVNLIHQGY